VCDDSSDRQLADTFVAWLQGDTFTCLAGRAASRRRDLVVAVYPDLRPEGDVTPRLHADLLRFQATHLTGRRLFASFAAVFAAPAEITEGGFEALLWDQLGRLHHHDAQRHPWAPGVSADPSRPDFAFSVGGHAYFVAGLNPAASRLSRRFARPVLVFNSHEQFDRLKADGTYGGLQGRIRARELRLQGSLNPMLAEHGDVSEAAQYSGRRVEPGWQCPFRPSGG
jgi:hypothetical protein